jgi:hypothetical protein
MRIQCDWALVDLGLQDIMAFKKLVRYETEGTVHYGDLLETDSTGHKVQRLSGSLGNFKQQFEIDTVDKVRFECGAHGVDMVFADFRAATATVSIGEDTRHYLHRSQLQGARKRSFGRSDSKRLVLLDQASDC